MQNRDTAKVLKSKVIKHAEFLFRDPVGHLKHLSRVIWRRYGPTRKDYQKRFGMNLHQWMLYHQKTVAFNKCHWMGVPSFKNPCDAWIYQEIIAELRPDIIIEVGSAHGGSTLYLANLLDLIGKGSIISIDIDRSRFSVSHPRIIVLTGDSASPEIVSKATELCQGKSVLVIHDGDHSKQAVLKDLHAYAQLVSINSYLIVEDGVQDLFHLGDGIGTYEEGPLAATEQFLQENQHFMVDMERERYILTYNPKGFLKRVK